MDINFLEAKILGQRVADGHMAFVSNSICDSPRRQMYGITTQQRFYRFNEDSSTYNILAKNRDPFEMVRYLNSSEIVLQDDTFTNLTLLLNKMFYEIFMENWAPSTQKGLIFGAVFARPLYLIGLTFLQTLVSSAVFFSRTTKQTGI